MKDFVVSQGCPLVNPDVLHDVDELRQALHDANVIAMDLGMRFREMRAVAHETSQSIAWLIVARRRLGDAAALRLLGQLEEDLLTPGAPHEHEPDTDNLH